MIFVSTIESEIFLYLILACLCLLCEASAIGGDVGNSTLPPVDHVTAGRGRSSKRVLAPENFSEETIRCTRQRATREKQVATLSLVEATEGGLVPDSSANQNQEEINNTEQGK